jgi:hypothetical protein
MSFVTSAKPGGPIYTEDEAEEFEEKSKKKARHTQAVKIRAFIDAFDPITYLRNEDEPSAKNKVRKRFMNAPQESWNPKTGVWSYSISWIYEINDPWAFPSSDYIDPNIPQTESSDDEEEPDKIEQDDKFDHPYPGQSM